MNILEKMALIINIFYIIQTTMLYVNAQKLKEMYSAMGSEIPMTTTFAQGPLPLVVIVLSLLLSAFTFLPTLKDKNHIRGGLLVTALIIVLACHTVISSGVFAPILDMATGI